jgi:hypothetical protein
MLSFNIFNGYLHPHLYPRFAFGTLVLDHLFQFTPKILGLL